VKFRDLRRRLDPDVRRARERALKHVEARNPDASATNATLRAAETKRYVFAVFYREAGKLVVPERYSIVAVARDGDDVEELEATPASPYWIRGRK
jgi:hypothetical protein